jgi:hypothetical protein
MSQLIEMSSSVFLSESVGANATKAEPKDPEDASSVMLRQGIHLSVPGSSYPWKQNDLRRKEFFRKLPEIVL